jgi:hypothetical protein
MAEAEDLLLAIVFEVELRCFARVVRRVLVVTVGEVRVMPGRFRVARFVMLRRFVVVAGSMLVMLSGAPMVLCSLFGHGTTS